jgi:uncharacterized protein (TIGR02300 family)
VKAGSVKRGALTVGHAYGKAPAASDPVHRRSICPRIFEKDWRQFSMVKPEWGTKRTCPKCSARFYDLGKDNPVHCIACENEFVPEPVLKSKQPMPFEAPTAAAVAKEETADSDLGAEDLVPDEDEEPSPDDEFDLGTGDDDLGVETAGNDDDQ